MHSPLLFLPLLIFANLDRLLLKQFIIWGISIATLDLPIQKKNHRGGRTMKSRICPQKISLSLKD